MATYFKFPNDIISAWKFQLEMTYTLSTLKGNIAKQTMNEIQTKSEAIKIHFFYVYYRHKTIIQKPWEP